MWLVVKYLPTFILVKHRDVKHVGLSLGLSPNCGFGSIQRCVGDFITVTTK